MNLEDVTIIIKTFERPSCLFNLVTSIRKYYATLPIYIADDGKHHITFNQPRVTTFLLPFDSGLSFGRNYLVEHVKTPYFLLLDDDYIFTERTCIDTLLKILVKHHYDIVAGHVFNLPHGPFHFEGNIEVANQTLTVHRNVFHATYPDHVVCDIVPNFFLGNTTTVKTSLWDPQFKLGEHVDFFLRAMGKLTVAYCPTVVINHDRKGGSPYYQNYRERISNYRDAFKQKHSITNIKTVEPDGNCNTMHHAQRHADSLILLRRDRARSLPRMPVYHARNQSPRLRP